MPKTIIIRRTWRCQVCYQAGCWRCQWGDDALNGQKCPHCGVGVVVEETDPNKCGTLIVKGEEDIEPEIMERTESNFRSKRQDAVSSQADKMDLDGDFPTATAKSRFIAQRHEEVENTIQLLRAKGYFLDTPTQISAYRAQRVTDIQKAIAAARVKEKK